MFEGFFQFHIDQPVPIITITIILSISVHWPSPSPTYQRQTWKEVTAAVSVVCLQSKQWLQRQPGPGLSGRVCLIDPPLPLCLDVLTGGSPLHILLRLRPIIPTISCCKSERPCFTSFLEGQTSSRRCFFFRETKHFNKGTRQPPETLRVMMLRQASRLCGSFTRNSRGKQRHVAGC